MSPNPIRLEKPMVLTSAMGLSVALFATLSGNLLIAAATIGSTYVLLGLMLDYAVAAHCGEIQWLSASAGAAQFSIGPASDAARGLPHPG